MLDDFLTPAVRLLQLQALIFSVGNGSDHLTLRVDGTFSSCRFGVRCGFGRQRRHFNHISLLKKRHQPTLVTKSASSTCFVEWKQCLDVAMEWGICKS